MTHSISKILEAIYPVSGMLILMAIWVYLFYFANKNQMNKPWGFILIPLGVWVSGHSITLISEGVVYIPVVASFIIALSGILLNVNNIQELINIKESKNLFVFSGIGLIFGLLLGFAFLKANVTQYLESVTDYITFALIAGSIQNSIAEEIISRGLLFGYLRKYGLSAFVATTIQGIVFAALHISRYSDNWGLLSIIFLFGIVAGYITLKSNNLIPACILHIVVNLFAVVWRLGFNFGL